MGKNPAALWQSAVTQGSVSGTEKKLTGMGTAVCQAEAPYGEAINYNRERKKSRSKKNHRYPST